MIRSLSLMRAGSYPPTASQGLYLLSHTPTSSAMKVILWCVVWQYRGIIFLVSVSTLLQLHAPQLELICTWQSRQTQKAPSADCASGAQHFALFVPVHCDSAQIGFCLPFQGKDQRSTPCSVLPWHVYSSSPLLCPLGQQSSC